MTLNIVSSFNGVSDPDAAAYIEAVEAADGQLLEFGVGKAINDFVLGCKADRIWDAIKASCILAGARTLSGALVPLKGTAPTNNNFVAGDYNRETGLVGDGSTKYLDSNRAGNADPQNNAHISTYLSSSLNDLGAAIGFQSLSPAVQSVIFRAGGNMAMRLNSATGGSVAGVGTATGLMGCTRSNSSNISYRINSTNGTISDSSATPQSLNSFVFAYNRAGTADLVSSPRIAFYSIGEALDLALLDARVTALITAIGAAIP